MKNVKTRTEGTKLIIEIDTGEKGELSASGKSEVIASTQGNVSILTDAGEFKLGVNFYKARK